MKLIGTVTTNKRPENDEVALRTTPTEGSIQLTNLAMQALKAATGDYISFQPFEDEANGTKGLVIFKGKKGMGQKIGAQDSLSSRVTWDELDGTTEKSMVYFLQVDKAEVVTIPGLGDTNCIPIVFERAEPKQVKAANGEGKQAKKASPAPAPVAAGTDDDE